MSYESFAAPENFFYSNSYSFFNAPTVSGVRAEYKINDRWSVLGACTTGENTSFENRFDDNGFLFQFRFKPTKKTSFKYSFLLERNNGLNKYPNAGSYGRDYLSQDANSHHLVFVWDITPRWRYVIEGFACTRDENRTDGKRPGYANGVNQNLIYKINAKWSVGGRFEWLKARNTLFDLAYLTGGSGVDICSWTLGVDWQPTSRLKFCPELRYDLADYADGYRPFDNGNRSGQLTGALSMTVKF